MRHKLRLLNLVLIVVFIFSFTACTTPKTATEATVTTIIETTASETTTSEATTKYKIAFDSGRDGNVEIYIMNVDGSEQVRLTNNPAGDGGPSFSPIP